MEEDEIDDEYDDDETSCSEKNKDDIDAAKEQVETEENDELSQDFEPKQQQQEQDAAESIFEGSSSVEEERNIETVCHSEDEDDEGDLIEEDPMKIKGLNEKIARNFKRTSDDDQNACARCGLVYVLRKPRKEKQQVSKVFN